MQRSTSKEHRTTKKYKNKYGDIFQYIEYNNVFLEVQKVQNATVNFYKVKVGGVQHIS